MKLCAGAVQILLLQRSHPQPEPALLINCGPVGRGLRDVAGRHLPLLLASDHVVHRSFQETTTGTAVNFTEPFARFAAGGLADGSIFPL